MVNQSFLEKEVRVRRQNSQTETVKWGNNLEFDLEFELIDPKFLKALASLEIIS